MEPRERDADAVYQGLFSTAQAIEEGDEQTAQSHKRLRHHYLGMSETSLLNQPPITMRAIRVIPCHFRRDLGVPDYSRLDSGHGSLGPVDAVMGDSDVGGQLTEEEKKLISKGLMVDDGEDSVGGDDRHEKEKDIAAHYVMPPEESILTYINAGSHDKEDSDEDAYSDRAHPLDDIIPHSQGPLVEMAMASLSDHDFDAARRERQRGLTAELRELILLALKFEARFHNLKFEASRYYGNQGGGGGTSVPPTSTQQVYQQQPQQSSNSHITPVHPQPIHAHPGHQHLIQPPQSSQQHLHSQQPPHHFLAQHPPQMLHPSAQHLYQQPVMNQASHYQSQAQLHQPYSHQPPLHHMTMAGSHVDVAEAVPLTSDGSVGIPSAPSALPVGEEKKGTYDQQSQQQGHLDGGSNGQLPDALESRFAQMENELKGYCSRLLTMTVDFVMGNVLTTTYESVRHKRKDYSPAMLADNDFINRVGATGVIGVMDGALAHGRDTYLRSLGFSEQDILTVKRFLELEGIRSMADVTQSHVSDRDGRGNGHHPDGGPGGSGRGGEGSLGVEVEDGSVGLAEADADADNDGVGSVGVGLPEHHDGEEEAEEDEGEGEGEEGEGVEDEEDDGGVDSPNPYHHHSHHPHDHDHE